jgi:hypothetical protein
VRSQQIRKLVERILDKTFVEWCEPRRSRGDSWDEISAELSAFLEVKVSRETVRRWYTLP